jgi:hypothetical protein
LELAAGLGLVETYIALLNIEDAKRELDSLKPLLLNTTSSCFLGQELLFHTCIHWRQRDNIKAHELFLEAITVLDNSNCEYEWARANLVFASFLKDWNQVEKARDVLIQAKDMFTKLKNHSGMRAVDKRIANL